MAELACLSLYTRSMSPGENMDLSDQAQFALAFDLMAFGVRPHPLRCKCSILLFGWEGS